MADRNTEYEIQKLLWAWLCHTGGEASNREGRGKCEVDGEELSDYLDVDEGTEYKAVLIKSRYTYIYIYICININNTWVLFSCLSKQTLDIKKW